MPNLIADAERLRESDPLAVLEEAHIALSATLSVVRQVNDLTPLRCRELSVALTNHDTGQLWLERAIADIRERRDAGAATLPASVS